MQFQSDTADVYVSEIGTSRDQSPDHAGRIHPTETDVECGKFLTTLIEQTEGSSEGMDSRLWRIT